MISDASAAVIRLGLAGPVAHRSSLHRLLTFSLLMGLASALRAQERPPNPRSIHWWEGAAAFGGVALASAFDETVQRRTQEARSRSGDDLASVVRRMGQPEVFGTIPCALFATGILTGRPTLRRAGERVAGSLLLAGALSSTCKLTLGRLRPYQASEPYDFEPFSGDDAFPSGHTTMAFALATSLANEFDRPWATAGLMVAAAGTGWSRLNDNAHWLSDVVAGSALGIASAEFIDGRWTIFHLHSPDFFFSPRDRGVRCRMSF